MKQELLEYIIRESVKEVLSRRLSEGELDTVGAPAPPAQGQGTADQPEIPSNNPPSRTFTVDAKGIWYIDPKNPNKPIKLTLRAKDPAGLERELYFTASKSAGPAVKVSASTLRAVRGAVANPMSAVFLYIGKQNEDDENNLLFLLPARNFEEAVASSVGPEATTSYSPTAIAQDDLTQPPQPPTGGRTQAPNIDEGGFKNMLSTMIKESLKSVRKAR